MRLTSLRIENFRSFKDETICFNDYTCLVGPNGAGKSAILNALNVFFRNSASSATNVLALTDEDYHHKNVEVPIRITLTFEDLSEGAKDDFKHYFRQDKLIVFAKASWDREKKIAEVKQYGSRLVMRAFARFFEADNKGAKVGELKEVYREIMKEVPNLEEPSTKVQMVEALRSYEEANPEKCELLDDTEQFYGWTRGENKLRKYIQWVFVPAVKDASSEQEESSKTALGQLLERTIRTRVSFEQPISDLKKQLEQSYKEIIDKERQALAEVQKSIEGRLRKWASSSATVDLNWYYDPDKSLVINEPVARVAVGEDDFVGEIARLGHGMQRAFIVSMLQELASSDQEHSPKLLLGFEEPELYQHPPQAQHIANVLEELATQAEGNAQIIVSTHSPYFVSTRGFENVRVVRKQRNGCCSSVRSTTFGKVEKCLADALGETPASPSSLMARVEQVMRPSQKELFFCKAMILVEGIEDIAFISTHLELSKKWSKFRELGCHFVEGGGKTSLSRPLAIAKELSIPVFIVFDSDAHTPSRDTERDNSCILKLCGADGVDSLPRENFFGKNLVMWKSKIGDVIRDDFGAEVWDFAEAEARGEKGFTDVRRKNSMLITATLEKLNSSGNRSELLDRLCNKILDFAEHVVS
jgi:predicted ATP-dependent endonuclease of OLD family